MSHRRFFHRSRATSAAAVAITFSLAVWAASTGAAWASSLPPGASGGAFLPGLLHPVLGFDHLLAMVAVGLLSVQMGGRAIWTTPSCFVAGMAVGGALGLLGVDLPQVEGFIALSVLILGFMIARGAAPSFSVAMAVALAFAVFHGHAHGAEIPALAAPGAYVAGFLLATALLHLTGVGLGIACDAARRPERLRALLGAGVAGIGLHMTLLSYAVV